MISRLNKENTGTGKYLLDANIWIMILDQESTLAIDPQNISDQNEKELNRKKREYLMFFELLTMNPQNKIVLPLVLLSEVLYTYMNNVSYRQYMKENRIPPQYYQRHKKTFRGSEKFGNDFDEIKYTIFTYEQYCELISDNFGGKYDPQGLLEYPEKIRDFNDNFYYHLAKENEYTLVTHDGDFQGVHDVKILTLNDTLLRR